MAQSDQIRRMGETLHDIVAGDAFLDTLVETTSDEKALAELKANARAHLQRKGLAIPDEVSVEFTEGPPWGVSLGLTGKGGGRYHIEARSEKRGPETDPQDRARFRRLERKARDIMASDGLLNAVEEAAKNQDAFAKFKANPRAHLQRKGVGGVPDDVQMKITEGSCCFWFCWWWYCWRICVVICV